MQKNDLLKLNDIIFRILDLDKEKVFIVNCIKRSVPYWCEIKELSTYTLCDEEELYAATNFIPPEINELDNESKRFAYEHYSLISGVLPFIGDNKSRTYTTAKAAEYFKVSKQTINNNLWLYLVYQTISALAPRKCSYKKPLTADEKNIRWALNKFFYTSNKNSLQTAYTFMLKERYCNSNGVLLENYPTIHQFRYFYRKHKKQQTFLISRNGLRDYQRNSRPLLGESIRDFANNIGVAMFDSTICDIYLLNDEGDLVGRPILTACVDAYSSMCMGYFLSWQGGVFSLKGLLNNIITEKSQWCKKFGIILDEKSWDCDGHLPGVFVTDRGNEYLSKTFEQLTELGIKIINLPPYRPELKGAIEKFFDIIQNLFKVHLKGKGVVEPDFQERGSHDYRKDACLTMREFETILLNCIVYYNSGRIVENFPYTDEMISEGIRPYACDIWNYARTRMGTNIIPVDSNQIEMSLLPRTFGQFTRSGLRVNKLRYKANGYTEHYLGAEKNSVIVAYNPDDVSCVWLVEKGNYIKFELIEKQYTGETFDEITKMKTLKRDFLNAHKQNNTQTQIDLANHIATIAKNSTARKGNSSNSIRAARQKESRKQKSTMGGGKII